MERLSFQTKDRGQFILKHSIPSALLSNFTAIYLKFACLLDRLLNNIQICCCSVQNAENCIDALAQRIQSGLEVVNSNVSLPISARVAKHFAARFVFQHTPSLIKLIF